MIGAKIRHKFADNSKTGYRSIKVRRLVAAAERLYEIASNPQQVTEVVLFISISKLI